MCAVVVVSKRTAFSLQTTLYSLTYFFAPNLLFNMPVIAGLGLRKQLTQAASIPSISLCTQDLKTRAAAHTPATSIVSHDRDTRQGDSSGARLQETTQESPKRISKNLQNNDFLDSFVFPATSVLEGMQDTSPPMMFLMHDLPRICFPRVTRVGLFFSAFWSPSKNLPLFLLSDCEKNKTCSEFKNWSLADPCFVLLSTSWVVGHLDKERTPPSISFFLSDFMFDLLSASSVAELFTLDTYYCHWIATQRMPGLHGSKTPPRQCIYVYKCIAKL